MPGEGAEDAWCTTSLQFELARLQGDTVTGGAADIYKGLGQTRRPLLYMILRIMVCPHTWNVWSCIMTLRGD